MMSEQVLPENVKMEGPSIQEEFCLNCCLSLAPKNNNSTSPSQVESESSSSLNSANIPRVLSSIFKLDYLRAFIDVDLDPDLFFLNNTDVKLCDDCMRGFTTLLKGFEEFQQLRSINSCLAKAIKKLDDCIQHQIIRKIKQEPNIEQQQQQQQRQVKTRRRRSKKLKIPTMSSLSLHTGPLVVMQRLENDPDPAVQAVFSGIGSKRRGRPKKITSKKTRRDAEPEIEIEDTDLNFQQAYDANDDDYFQPPTPDEADSDDYPVGSFVDSDKESGSKKKKTTTKKRKERASEQKNPNRKRGRPAKNVDVSGEEDGENKTTKKRRKQQNRNRSLPSNNKRSLAGMERRKQSQKETRKYRRRKTYQKNPCWYCDLDFPSQSDCLTHTRETHFTEKKGSSICERCSKISTSEISHQYHQNICETFNPGELLPTLVCEVCGKEYPGQSELTVHMYSHEDAGVMLTCSTEGCTYQTKNPYQLKVHVKSKHVEQPGENQCQDCGRLYKSKYKLNYHRVVTHTEEGAKRYKEQRRAALDRQKIERKERLANTKNICPECDVDFFTSFALIHHRKKFHGTSFAHACDKCSETFSTPSTLKRHIQHAHSEARDYVCQFCAKAYKTYSNLNDHVRRMHSEIGRKKWNAQMREFNRRKKVRDEALAQVTKGLQHSTVVSAPQPSTTFQLINLSINGVPTTMNENQHELEDSSSASNDNDNNTSKMSEQAFPGDFFY